MHMLMGNSVWSLPRVASAVRQARRHVMRRDPDGCHIHVLMGNSVRGWQSAAADATAGIQMFGGFPPFKLPPNGNPIDLEVGCRQYKNKCESSSAPSQNLP
jgi:hypothetical protein